jgi:hypothetical protein
VAVRLLQEVASRRWQFGCYSKWRAVGGNLIATGSGDSVAVGGSSVATGSGNSVAAGGSSVATGIGSCN